MNNSIVLAPAKPITLLDPRDFLPLWIEHLKLREQAQELTADTISTYIGGARRFLDWLTDNPSPEAILAWKAYMLTSKYKGSTVNAWLSGVRSFFSWLAETHQIPFDPAEHIKGVTRKGTTQRHGRQNLTDQEAIRLMNTPDRDTPQGKRDYAIIMLMLYAGPRSISIFRADLEDLGTEGGKTVLFTQGKGHHDKDAILVLTPEVAEALHEWLAVRGSKPGALFTSLAHRNCGERLGRRSIRGSVKKNLLRAGIVSKTKTTHSLRHTAATSAVNHGASLQDVQAMLDHNSIDTTMIYFHQAKRVSNSAEEKISYTE